MSWLLVPMESNPPLRPLGGSRAGVNLHCVATASLPDAAAWTYRRRDVV